MKHVVLLLLFVLIAMPAVFAQGYGTSEITLNATQVTLVQGASVKVQYSVKLYSGSTWGTTISLENSSALSSEGLSASFSNSYGDPTYTGIMTISASANAQPGNYVAYIEATGDDPSISPAILNINVESASPAIPTNLLPKFVLINSSTKLVNGSTGVTVSVANNSITATVRPGTYVMIGNSILKQYNFTLALFNASGVPSPPNESYYVPVGAYAFAVNGRISPLIEFVNASGKPMPIISTVMVKPNMNITSWTFLGGTFNGTVYIGGKYAFADTWKRINSTAITNTAFFKPVMWVFELYTKPNTTSVPATQPQPAASSPTNSTRSAPSNNGNNVLDIAAALIVIIVVVIAVYLALKPRKK
ncbi:MAG: hypothetical protein ACP5MX_02395 [Candidatus Micrarchaeia archaeon]